MPEPKILLFDIETSPNLAYVWKKYEQDVLAYEQEWFMLCFSYLWLGEDIVRTVALPDFKTAYKADHTDDFKVVEKLHGLFTDASVVIGHNSNSFDNKKTNARFLYHGFDPPEPYKTIDTCLVARKYFSYNSNKLGDLGETLGLGSKGTTSGFSTWLGCMSGEKTAWAEMRSYNARDVELLREVYLRLRPWIDNHPNVAFMEGETAAPLCPKCGSDNLIKQGVRYNRTTASQRWSCQECGGWSFSRLSEKIVPPVLIN